MLHRRNRRKHSRVETMNAINRKLVTKLIARDADDEARLVRCEIDSAHQLRELTLGAALLERVDEVRQSNAPHELWVTTSCARGAACHAKVRLRDRDRHA